MLPALNYSDSKERPKTPFKASSHAAISLFNPLSASLRHTHSTLLLANGENAKVASEGLGHSTIVLTLDTYSDVLPDMRNKRLSVSKTYHSGSDLNVWRDLSFELLLIPT
jgi:hypothetical protein